jgi:hypothetical protein
MTMTVQALPLIKMFAIAPDCEVITETKPQASVEDLRIGDEVEVTYQDVSGTLIAHRIIQRNGTESRLVLESILTNRLPVSLFPLGTPLRACFARCW